MGEYSGSGIRLDDHMVLPLRTVVLDNSLDIPVPLICKISVTIVLNSQGSCGKSNAIVCVENSTCLNLIILSFIITSGVMPANKVDKILRATGTVRRMRYWLYSKHYGPLN